MLQKPKKFLQTLYHIFWVLEWSLACFNNSDCLIIGERFKHVIKKCAFYDDVWIDGKNEVAGAIGGKYVLPLAIPRIMIKMNVFKCGGQDSLPKLVHI